MHCYSLSISAMLIDIFQLQLQNCSIWEHLHKYCNLHIQWYFFFNLHSICLLKPINIHCSVSHTILETNFAFRSIPLKMYVNVSLQEVLTLTSQKELERSAIKSSK